MRGMDVFLKIKVGNMKKRDNIQVEFFFEFIYLFASSNLFFLILIIYIFSRHTTMRNMHMRK